MFTQKELYCIDQVSRLAIRLTKNKKKLDVLKMSQAKKETALLAAVKKYTAEKAEEEAIHKQMTHFRQVLAECLRDVQKEPTEPVKAVAHTEAFEYTGREA